MDTYELVQHWAEDLELDQFFKLKADPANGSSKGSPNEFLESIEVDPLGQDGLSPEEESQMKKFIESNSDGKVNMAIVIHMAKALRFFKIWDKEETQNAAIELAILGRNGIDPFKEGYKLSFASSEKFSGNKVLAFMYVSWALTQPEFLGELGLPYAKEYKLACNLERK
jgi:hypothetical protein